MTVHKVCIVDDDSDCIKLIASHIGKQLPKNATTVAFSDSLVAENWLLTNVPMLVICDLQLVDRNGFHLLKSVKQNDPLTPVIVVTGHGTENALKSAILLGADDFIAKPYNARDLLHSIRYLVERADRWRTIIEDEKMVLAQS